MIVKDILSEAKEVLGRCSDEVVFRRITDAVRLANNKGKFDAALGIMDLCVCDGCVTLPADVATVLGVMNAGQPTLLRDQWFEFHANGPGAEGQFVPWGYTNEMGPVSTYKDPADEVKLVAQVENAKDSGKVNLRVFGWDKNGKRIYTTGADGVLEDGFLVPDVYGFAIPNPDAPSIYRIDRVTKNVTNGFVKLIAVDPFSSSDTKTTIGHYLPWETTPSYRRIRVPDRSWLRIKYRRKDIEVRGENDWINIEHRLALLLLIKAVKFRLNEQFEAARAAEADATNMLSEEAESLRPPAVGGPQVIWNEGLPAANSEGLFYGGLTGRASW